MILREVLGMWTVVTRFIDGERIKTMCCCKEAGRTPRECSVASGNKTPCRCACHRTTIKKKKVKQLLSWQKDGF